jgi:hypothetical protein
MLIVVPLFAKVEHIRLGNGSKKGPGAYLTPAGDMLTEGVNT